MSCSINDANLEVMFLLFHLEGLYRVVSFSVNDYYFGLVTANGLIFSPYG